MVYDVPEVRGQYVSLSDGWTYLNAHARPQVPQRVVSSVARAFRTATSPLTTAPSSGHHASTRDDQYEGQLHLQSARRAIADFVGGSPQGVVLGPSLEALYTTLAFAMRPMLKRGSNIVLSNLDRPVLTQVLAAATDDIRWAQPDLATGELPAYQYDSLITPATRLVAIPAAHEVLGTVTPVTRITELAHAAARLWVLVDATAYACYRPVDMSRWDADIVAIDVARLGGPNVAALVFRDELMLSRLRPANPLASEGTAESLETPVSEGLAGGVSALVDHYANLARPARDDVVGGSGSGEGTWLAHGGNHPASENPGAGGPLARRDRIVYSMGQTAAYLKSLGRDLEAFIGSLPAVHILGVSGEAVQGANNDRVPRISFGVRGVPAHTVYRRLLDNGLVTTLTPNSQLLEDMGAGELGGTVTVSLAPFNQDHDIEHLTRVVASLA